MNTSKYNSRKLFVTLLILFMSFGVILFKVNDPDFINYFKQWTWLAIGVFTIYTSGNIGQKFSRKSSKKIQEN